jgi:hypothetical protein
MAFDFITPEYFHNTLALPNLGVGSIERTAFNEVITKYVKEYLETILGFRLASRLISIMDSYDPLDPSSTDVMYRYLVFGTTYVNEIDGLTYKWGGFTTHLDDDGTILGDKISPIANYVYCRYRRDTATNTMGNSEVMSVHEHSITSSPLYKMVTAWNEMVKMNWHMHNWLMLNVEDSAFSSYGYIGETYEPDTDQFSDIHENQNLFIFKNRVL